MAFIISIEGNIGSGKTTLLSMLQNELGTYMGRSRPVVYVKEPVAEWESIKDEAGMSMLDHLYKDSKTHAFAFQMMAYITRLRSLREAKKAHPGAILVTERCLQTDCNVFAKMLNDSGDIMGIHY
jgi:deoxyadenosine/deoxycytidine kinase